MRSEKLDWTPLEHVVIAVVITIWVGFLTGNYFAGAGLASGIFIGREHSQAEYRWMDWKKVNRTGKETLGAFNPEVWGINSLMDCGLPVLASILTGSLITFWAA